jgi:glutaredoxin
LQGRKLTHDDFLKRLDDKYECISKYVSNITPITLFCRKHQKEFEISPKHLFNGYGCPYCLKDKETENFKNRFIRKSKEIHGENEFDYSLVDYINNITPVKLIHKDHIIEVTPMSHLHGNRCIVCSNKFKKSTEYFINFCNKIHDYKYDYSLVDYETNRSIVKIICPKHDIFSQRANHHMLGTGCPYCRESLGEKFIVNFLKENNIIYNRNKTFEGCKRQKHLHFDFYLSEYNICVEFDGTQHTKIVNYWGGEEGLKLRLERDKIKNEYCKDNNIKLIRINNIEDIHVFLNELIKNEKIILIYRNEKKTNFVFNI